MLEEYFSKPATLDRVRQSWIATEIERYLAWMEYKGHAAQTIHRRIPVLVQFGDYAKAQGAKTITELHDHVVDFVTYFEERSRCCRSTRRQKVFRREIHSCIRQMLSIDLPGYDGRSRSRRTTQRERVPDCGGQPLYDSLTDSRHNITMQNANRESEIRKHLQSGELLLWWEQPRSWRMVLWPSLLAIPWSAVQLLFGIWWILETLRLKTHDPTNIFLWIVLITGWLIALGATGGFLCPVMSWITARRTIYAVTDSRVLVFLGNAWPREVKSYRWIKQIEPHQTFTGKGDLAFVGKADSDQDPTSVRLEGISDVATVERLIRRIDHDSLTQAATD